MIGVERKKWNFSFSFENKLELYFQFAAEIILFGEKSSKCLEF